ncbi:MAG: ABC transporter ATP-binding protein [Promethearchaeota archaeon CR_4]|nr:MAG: ABC transporter ATP-binding protein [Candidatus Lokiarchaeota archaeon CR_4]
MAIPAAEWTSILDIKDFSKTFDGTTNVLENISFQVSKGEIFVIIGPSGVGKTTLLRLINLLEFPSAGSLMIKGIDTTPLTQKQRLELRRKQGMVFQSTILFNESVYANVAYGLKIREVPKNEIDEKVSKALKVVGLEDLKYRHAKTLSGGETQRIAIARVLAYEPDLLLLDELTANLDPSNTAKIEKVVKDVRDTFGTTILVATHNMFQAKRIADHVAVLFNGRFIEVGNPQIVFEHPQNPLTKSFINGELIY